MTRPLGLAPAVSLALALSSAAPQAQERATTYTYREVDGQVLHAFVFSPEAGEQREARSAILLFHGGGWHTGRPEWASYTEHWTPKAAGETTRESGRWASIWRRGADGAWKIVAEIWNLSPEQEG